MPVRIEDIAIRTELRHGDFGAVVRMHGLLYGREYRFGLLFEAYVAEALSELYRRWDPARDRAWLCESDGSLVGSLFLMHREDGAAQLRFFLVDPECRGLGLGKLLMDRFMEALRTGGYRSAYLWTMNELPAAASLYIRHGFRLTEEKETTTFGRPAVEQRYDLETVTR